MVNLAENKVKDCSSNKSSNLKIGVLPTVLPYVIDNILTQITYENQSTKVSLREDDSKSLSESCLKYELDYIITAAPLQDKRLTTHPLINDPFFVALREDHHLANREEIELNELREEPFILINNIHCLHEQISTFCRNSNFSPLIKFETGQIDTIQKLILAGHGISILPSISKNNSMPRMTYIPLKERPCREIIIAHRKDWSCGDSKSCLYNIIRNQ